MGSLYLTEMADWLRADGLPVKEYDSQWKTRSRSSGGYDAPAPLCIMWHHTASTKYTSAQSDADYMCKNSPDKPIANIMIARDGVVWVLAAGATNTNGKGRSVTFSKGTVPADSMNTRAVGIEICNDGLGEPYAQRMIDNAFKTSICLQRRLSMIASDCETHQDYAPDRKIDPSTAAAVQGPWRPGSVTSAGSWNVHDLRVEHAARWGAAPTPPGEDEMTEADWKRMADLIDQRVTMALNKGTGAGQMDWAGTCAATLGQTQNNYNQIRVCQAQLDELGASTAAARVKTSADDLG